MAYSSLPIMLTTVTGFAIMNTIIRGSAVQENTKGKAMQTAGRKQNHWLVTLGVWIAFYAAWLVAFPLIFLVLHQFTMLVFLVVNAAVNSAFPMRGRGASILLMSFLVACTGGIIGNVICRKALGVPFVHWYATTVTLFFTACIVQAGWFLKTNSTETDALAGKR